MSQNRPNEYNLPSESESASLPDAEEEPRKVESWFNKIPRLQDVPLQFPDFEIPRPKMVPQRQAPTGPRRNQPTSTIVSVAQQPTYPDNILNQARPGHRCGTPVARRAQPTSTIVRPIPDPEPEPANPVIQPAHFTGPCIWPSVFDQNPVLNSILNRPNLPVKVIMTPVLSPPLMDAEQRIAESRPTDKAAAKPKAPPKAAPNAPPKAPPRAPPKAPPNAPAKAPLNAPPRALPNAPPRAPPKAAVKAPPQAPPNAPPNAQQNAAPKAPLTPKAKASPKPKAAKPKRKTKKPTNESQDTEDDSPVEIYVRPSTRYYEKHILGKILYDDPPAPESTNGNDSDDWGNMDHVLMDRTEQLKALYSKKPADTVSENKENQISTNNGGSQEVTENDRKKDNIDNYNADPREILRNYNESEKKKGPDRFKISLWSSDADANKENEWKISPERKSDAKPRGTDRRNDHGRSQRSHHKKNDKNDKSQDGGRKRDDRSRQTMRREYEEAKEERKRESRSNDRERRDHDRAGEKSRKRDRSHESHRKPDGPKDENSPASKRRKTSDNDRDRSNAGSDRRSDDRHRGNEHERDDRSNENDPQSEHDKQKEKDRKDNRCHSSDRRSDHKKDSEKPKSDDNEHQETVPKPDETPPEPDRRPDPSTSKGTERKRDRDGRFKRASEPKIDDQVIEIVSDSEDVLNDGGGCIDMCTESARCVKHNHAIELNKEDWNGVASEVEKNLSLTNLPSRPPTEPEEGPSAEQLINELDEIPIISLPAFEPIIEPFVPYGWPGVISDDWIASTMRVNRQEEEILSLVIPITDYNDEGRDPIAVLEEWREVLRTFLDTNELPDSMQARVAQQQSPTLSMEALIQDLNAMNSMEEVEIIVESRETVDAFVEEFMDSNEEQAQLVIAEASSSTDIQNQPNEQSAGVSDGNGENTEISLELTVATPTPINSVVLYVVIWFYIYTYFNQDANNDSSQ